MDALAEYRSKFPQVKIEFEFTDRMVDLVAEGYDIAMRAGDLADSGLLAKRIGLSYGCFAQSRENLPVFKFLSACHPTLFRLSNLWLSRARGLRSCRIRFAKASSRRKGSLGSFLTGQPWMYRFISCIRGNASVAESERNASALRKRSSEIGYSSRITEVNKEPCGQNCHKAPSLKQ